MSVVQQGVRGEPLAELSCFRGVFYDCLIGRRDALFELTDAVLCSDGPVKTLVGLALAPEHRRGHGALYGALNRGQVDVDRLRSELAGLPLPRAADGRLVLAVEKLPSGGVNRPVWLWWSRTGAGPPPRLDRCRACLPCRYGPRWHDQCRNCLIAGIRPGSHQRAGQDQTGRNK